LTPNALSPRVPAALAVFAQLGDAKNTSEKLDKLSQTQ